MLYDSGLKVPLIIRFPNQLNAGTVDDQLISFVDFVPTTLTLTHQELPSYLDGRNFIDSKTEKREYIHAAADRFDEKTDAIRAVRDHQFKYIRNYRPEQGYYLSIKYREKIPMMKELLRMRDNNELDDIQSLWFRKEKPKEELFDCLNDPHELNNLANDPKYAKNVEELSDEMDRWIKTIGDQPNLPERKLIAQLWNNAPEKPTTDTPKIKIKDGRIQIECTTKGASIGYKLESNKKADKKGSVN